VRRGGRRGVAARPSLASRARRGDTGAENLTGIL
jgi:hypothetical protein